MADVWYFAYGSNMDLARLETARLIPEGLQVKERVLGHVEGWQLVFNKPWSKFSGSGAANIMPHDSDHVYGTLNLMDARGLDVLDHYEGVAGGHYLRAPLRVHRPAFGDAVEAIAAGAQADISPAARSRVEALQSEVQHLRAHLHESLPTFIHRVARTTGLLVEAAAHDADGQAGAVHRGRDLHHAASLARRPRGATKPPISSSKPAMLGNLSGAASSFMRPTPSCRRIWAPMP